MSEPLAVRMAPMRTAIELEKNTMEFCSGSTANPAAAGPRRNAPPSN
jgi:hypothetical protein